MKRLSADPARRWLLLLCCSAGLRAHQAAAQTPAPNAESSGPPLDAEPTRAECVVHYEQSQLARRDGRLLDARARLLLCSRAVCPAAIRADCVDWLDQVQRSLPTLVVTARARGADLSGVRVFVDGRLLAERLTGGAFELDPGLHHFRFEAPPWPAIERELLMSEGVQRRTIEVEFAPAPATEPEPARIPVASPEPAPAARGAQTFDYVVGGVGALGFVSFVGFGAWALGQRHSLEKRCAPFCSKDDVSSVATKLLIADLALGTTLLSLSVLYLRLTRAPDPRAAQSAEPPEWTLFARATDRAAALGVRGEF